MNKKLREVPQTSRRASFGGRFFRLVLLGMVFLWGALGSLEAQGRAISGTVTDTQGFPMPGVNITVKESPGVGVITDIDGKYQITAPNDNAVLVYSFIGFQVEEISVSGRSVIDVILMEDMLGLEEVVVVGYGVQRRSDLTGALSSVSSEEIQRMPVANMAQAIQGRASGIDITSNERPGESGTIRIRGQRSLTASSDPLYVVDGIPLASKDAINNINPADIESIDILKDASSTAIYGSRGANGVILVTTKRAKKDALSMNYRGTLTIEKMYDRMEMMNSADYIEFRRDAYRTAGSYPDVPTRDADLAIFGMDDYAWANIEQGWAGGSWDGSRVSTTDWTDMVTRTALTQEHNLSVSGGSDNVLAYGSFGYLNQEGTQLGQEFERFSTNLNVEVTPVDWFKYGASVNASSSMQEYGFDSTSPSGARSLYAAALGMLPYAVPFDDNGDRINLPGGDVNILNPIGDEKYSIDERKTYRLLGSLFAEVNLMEGLRYRMNFGPDYYQRNRGIYRDAMSMNRGGGEPGSTNYAQYSTDSRFSWTLDNLVYYNTSFDQHNLGLTFLQTATSNRTETSQMTAENLPWNAQKWHQLNSVSALSGFGTNLVETTMTSYMGRVNYGFADKYLLTASARWDGASQLAEGNKWDFFPSAALAWRLEQEDFLAGVHWVNQLKARVGVGTTGNSAIGAYQTLGAITQLYYTWGESVDGGYVSSDASLATPNPMANQDLGWEKTTQWNLGVDFSFLNSTINGSLDVYTSRTSDLLMRMGIPALTGYTTTFANVGETSNKGIDLNLNTYNFRGRDFSWTTDLVFSANRDKIEELSMGKVDDINNLWFIGERLAVGYDYLFDGIWQDTPEDLAEMAKFNANGHAFQPGSIRVKDLDGDYQIDPDNDRGIVGHSAPSWTAGLTNTFTYKNWDFSFFIYSRWNFMVETGAERLQGRFAQRKVNYWTPDNPSTEYPRPNYNNFDGDVYRTSMNYQDGSFIKLRNVSLGYNLPANVASRLGISNMKVFGQLMNPGLLYSKIDWIDPDLGGSTFNRGVVFGVNIGF